MPQVTLTINGRAWSGETRADASLLDLLRDQLQLTGPKLGCGEGHQTEYLAKLSDEVYGVDVSPQAVDRARRRLPAAQFATADIFSQPWGETPQRFDLVTAFEVLYYLSDPAATIAQMRKLGRNGIVTFFAPAAGRIGPHLADIPGLQKDWIFHGGTAWLVGWWRDE